jgi:hypothetical protein
MSHRAEEKERRRQERMAAEQSAQQSSDRRKRFALVGGVVLVAAIAVIVVLAIATGGDEGPNQAQGDVVAPTFGVDNVNEAARAAGCELKAGNLREEGRGHTSKAVTYQTNPPTSGDHDPVPAEDGIYAPDNPPDVEQSVHALEHGRINFQYKQGTPTERINQLETMIGEDVKGEGGYHSLLFRNQTNMTAAVAATAWRSSLTCPEWNDKVFDALRAFRRSRVDKGPEFIP